MVSEEQKKEYQDYVKEITPTHNTPRNIFRAFWTGGTVCVIGQILSVFFEKMGMGKEAAGTVDLDCSCFSCNYIDRTTFIWKADKICRSRSPCSDNRICKWSGLTCSGSSARG